MIQITAQMKVLVALDPVDFRRGIDGLAQACRQQLQADPFSGTLFVFRSRAGTSVKVLAFSGDGFWMCQKRLSKGRFAWWPSSPDSTATSARLLAHELQVLLCGGDPCPECPNGKMYPQAEPATMVRVKGVAPFAATIYELERWRCNLCDLVITAPAPEGVGPNKYDESVAALVGLLRYGVGLPHNRIAKLQMAFGIPLPVSTQWEIVLGAAGLLLPAFSELARQAAQGQLLHNDDAHEDREQGRPQQGRAQGDPDHSHPVPLR